MKIPVDEIPQSPKEITFSEKIEELNAIYRRSSQPDFGFPPSIEVDLVYYRSGADIFFNGGFRGQFTGYCGRCLENYSFTLDKDFAFVLTPEPAKSERGAEELRSADLGLSYYSSDEIDLAPLIAEQVMLALPTRPLCSEDCRGLCKACGTNLNRETCDCGTETGDPRMAIFRTLKVGR
ncbi:MAG: YceD family protein [Candidatus Binatia bacterium]